MKHKINIMFASAILLLAIIPLNSVFAAAHTGISYDNTEIVNPGRGQYRSAVDARFNPKQSDGSFDDLGVEFPNQATGNKNTYPAWPSVKEQNFRIGWRSLEDGSGNYDFRSIDDMIARAKQSNSRVSLRVMSLDTSSSQNPISSNLYSVLPDRFTGMSAATETVTNGSKQYVVPKWDSSTYLSELEKLLSALGDHYNKNEYVSSFEMSGLGDFSEWHVYKLRGHYGGDDRPWSLTTIERAVNANIAAFPDTQLIGFVVDQRASAYMLDPTHSSVQPKKPMGFRIDSLGVETMDGNETRLNAVAGVNARWKTAPIAFEYSSNDETPSYDGGLYHAARKQLQQYHGSLVSGGNFPNSFNGVTMTSQQFDDWSKANKYAGYRYHVTNSVMPKQAVAPGTDMQLRLTWQNDGVAPTYDNWDVQYVFKPKGDSPAPASATINSSVNLKDIYYNDSSFRGEGLSPKTTSKTVTDNLMIPSELTTGSYDVYVQVKWAEHKTGASDTYNPVPMRLAMTDRTVDGSYLLGSVRVDTQAALPTAPDTGIAQSQHQQVTPALYWVLASAVIIGGGLILSTCRRRDQ